MPIGPGAFLLNQLTLLGQFAQFQCKKIVENLLIH